MNDIVAMKDGSLLPESERLDAIIAVNLFGWGWWRNSETGERTLLPVDGTCPHYDKRADMTEPLATDWYFGVPSYTVNGIYDAMVVEKIRLLNDASLCRRWELAVGRIWRRRAFVSGMPVHEYAWYGEVQYHPGDWSLAWLVATGVLRVKNQEEK